MCKDNISMEERLDAVLDAINRDRAKEYLAALRQIPFQGITSTHLRFHYANLQVDKGDWECMISDSPYGWQYWIGDSDPKADIDEKAWQQCHKRLLQLEKKRKDPQYKGFESQMAIKEEKAFIETYLISSGRHLSTADSLDNRLSKDYIYLKNAFNRLLKKVHKHDPEVAEYLKVHLKTGIYFRWVTD